jgi:DNA polymerase (family 10)
MSTNTDLAKIFHTIASILEIKGESGFKVNANTKVARTLEDLVEDISSVKDLTAIPGVGKSSAAKIKNYIETGTMPEYEALRNSIPSGLLDLMRVQGLGPKKVRQLWQDAGVVDIVSLRTAIDEDRLDSLPRMGKKTIENISQALLFIEESGNRTRIGEAMPVAESIADTLEKVDGVIKVAFAGSLRRGKETIGDIDILASTNCPDLLADTFCELDTVAMIQAKGNTKCSVRLKSGMQVDLRMVAKESFGAALLYFTGSKNHNIILRERAMKQNKKLNEYGLEPQNISEDEEAIYSNLGLPFIPPEIREDRGELNCKKTLDLITVKDIKCDLHCHTTASDGHMSIEELAIHAIACGYHTIAVTDHSQSQTQAGGLKPNRLKKHIEDIHEVNGRLEEITILAGSEVDILSDGTLDYDDELLSKLDIVVASPHSLLNQSQEDSTKRLLRAIEHPLVHIIGHPTGRIINKRKGLEPNMATVVAAAAKHNTALEINANSYRLDLRDTHVNAAVEAGAMLSINTDAHRQEDFEQLRYGVLTARRGWLQPDKCINCLGHDELQTWLGRNC